MSWDVELTSLPQPPQGQLNVTPGVSLIRCRSLAVAPGAAPSPASVIHVSPRDQRPASHPCEAGISSTAAGPDPQLLGAGTVSPSEWPSWSVVAAAARPRAAKPAAAQGQLELLPSLCLPLFSSLLPFNSLPVCSSLSPAVHPSLFLSHPFFPL